MLVFPGLHPCRHSMMQECTCDRDTCLRATCQHLHVTRATRSTTDPWTSSTWAYQQLWATTTLQLDIQLQLLITESCLTIPATGTHQYHRLVSHKMHHLQKRFWIFTIQEFQNEAEAEFTGLINTDEIVAAEPDNKIKDDDIDLALDALRNCDTDFIKFDEVNSFFHQIFIINFLNFRPIPSPIKYNRYINYSKKDFSP